MPLGRLAPMLATPAHAVPTAKGYAFEFKWDGMRALAHVDEQGHLRLESRNGNDVTSWFPELQAMGKAVGRKAVIDGEIVALDAKGRPDFGILQSRLGVTGAAPSRRQAAGHPVHFLAFDLLMLDGKPLVDATYESRRHSLEGLRLDGPSWGLTPARVDDGATMLDDSRRLGLEGIVAKRLTSRYAAGKRSDAWLKIRNRMRQEFVVGGWTKGEGTRRGSVGALLLGHYRKQGRSAPRLAYAGRVGSGFRGPELARLLRQLRELAQPECPFAEGADEEEASGDVHWVEPKLVAEVEFAGLTQHHVLRQASFKGMRIDKAAKEVVWEQA